MELFLNLLGIHTVHQLSALSNQNLLRFGSLLTCAVFICMNCRFTISSSTKYYRYLHYDRPEHVLPWNSSFPMRHSYKFKYFLPRLKHCVAICYCIITIRNSFVLVFSNIVLVWFNKLSDEVLASKTDLKLLVLLENDGQDDLYSRL